jgi:hypothetical protein
MIFESGSLGSISTSIVVTGSILSTEGFTGSLFGTASYAANIYNTDGDLTSNRTIGSGSGYKLTLNPELIFNAPISGISSKYYIDNQLNIATGNSLGTKVTSSISSSIVSFADIVNSSGSQTYYNTFNNINLSSATGSTSSTLYGDVVSTNIAGNETSSRITAIGSTVRVSRYGFSGSNDFSENINNRLVGSSITVNQYGGVNSSPSSYTGTMLVLSLSSWVSTGRVGTYYGIDLSPVFSGNNSTTSSAITTYYGVRLGATLGSTLVTSSIENYYAVYIDTPTVRTNSSISNRYGLYAPDPSMKHHISGSISIGTTETGSYKLQIVGDTSITGKLFVTGSNSGSVLTDFIGSTQNITASVIIQNNINLSSNSNETIRLSYKNLIGNRTNAGYSSNLRGNETNIYAGSTDASGRLSLIGDRININRTDTSDISTYSSNAMYGSYVQLNQGNNLTLDNSPKFSGLVRSYYSNQNIYQGTTNIAEGFRHFGVVGALNVGNALVTNYYGFRSNLQVGWTSGIYSSSITNHYGVYIDSPTINATGNITNNWGFYAPDPSMKHHISGSVSIGTVQTGSYELNVVGDTGISGSLVVTGSVQITNVLTLPAQDPLPSGIATGSIAVSGSGVDCKPYFWNGSTWTSLI